MFKTLPENAFKRALVNGDLCDLPGNGKPIKQSSLTKGPFAHTYAESGTMMPAVTLQARITKVREQLTKTSDPELQRAIKTKASELETRKAIEIETWKQYS